MEAKTEPQAAAPEAAPAATPGTGPLSQPLPLAGERSPTEAPASEPAAPESLLGSAVAEAEEAAPEPAAPPAEAPAEAARPSYSEFKLPEGVTLDAEQLAPATALFAESGLSQEQAQKFIDLALAREAAAAQRGVQAFADLQTQWVSEVKADADIGGGRLKASLATAGRAIEALAVPGLREALTFTGAGNHPAVVKAFVRLGQMIAEDRFTPSPPAPPAPRSPADDLRRHAQGQRRRTLSSPTHDASSEGRAPSKGEREWQPWLQPR